MSAEPGSRIALPLEITADDPALTILDLSDYRLAALARCIELPLVQSYGDGSTQTGLASTWSTSDGGLTWMLELQQVDTHLEDPGYLGRLFATHCKQILNKPETPLSAQLADLVQGADAYQKGAAADISGLSITDNMLTVALTRPNQFFPLWVSQPGLGVLEDREAAHASGYGPWRVVEFLASTEDGKPARLVLEPNPASLAGQPVAGQITFLLVADRAEQVALFQSGELQAANTPWQDAPGLEQQFPGKFVRFETAVPVVGQFDLSQFPWGDDKFQSKLGLRQALNWAIDREYLTELLNQQITGWTCFFPKPLSEFDPPDLMQNPTYPLGQDIPAAQRGLQLADHWDGSHLIPGMDLGYLDTADTEKEVVEVLKYWNDISVKMRPFKMTRAELRLRLDQGTHEIVYRRLYPAYPSPDALAYPYLYGALLGNGGNYWNQAQPGVDKAIKDAQAATAAADVTRSYRGLAKTLVSESLLVFIGYYTPAVLVSDKLAGLQLSPYDYSASLNMQDFTKLGLAE